MPEDDVVLLSQGEISLWTEDGRAVHLKAVSKFGDPVELSAEEARALAEWLQKMASMVE